MTDKIAIPICGTAGLEDLVEEHFGRAQHYTFISVEDGSIVSSDVLDVPFAGHGPGDLPNWVHSKGADTVLAWGMGPSAVNNFEKLGIKVVTGATGCVRDVVNSYIQGSLKTIEWEEPEGHGQGRRGHHH